MNAWDVNGWRFAVVLVVAMVLFRLVALGAELLLLEHRVPHVRRSVRTAITAGVALFALYAIVVGGASGSLRHLLVQMRADWYYIVPLMTGFGVQVGLVSELRRRHRLRTAAAGAGVAGAGASTAGMVACCAHHIADLAPFLGASAAATFLTSYKVPFILVGLAVNAAGIAVALRRLRSSPMSPVTAEEGRACAVA